MINEYSITKSIRGYALFYSRQDPIRHWTKIYYPDELKSTTLNEHKLQQSYVMYCKRHGKIEFDEYKRQYKQRNYKNRKDRYILQDEKNTYFFKSKSEIVYFLGSSPQTINSMLNTGKEYRNYTLDVLEA